MSKSQSEFPSPKKLCRALHSELIEMVTYFIENVHIVILIERIPNLWSSVEYK